MPNVGLITVPSKHSVKESLDRLEHAVQSKGMTVFARIDHAKGAAETGLTLRATEVLIFGSPTGGTPLMQVNQQIGLDLPLKVLAWQEETNKVWLTYDDVMWLGNRYGVALSVRSSLEALVNLLAALTRVAGN